jgi:hypothetical protein
VCRRLVLPCGVRQGVSRRLLAEARVCGIGGESFGRSAGEKRRVERVEDKGIRELEDDIHGGEVVSLSAFGGCQVPAGCDSRRVQAGKGGADETKTTGV